MCAFKKDTNLSEFIPKEKREYCVKELVETEAKYIEVLNMLKQKFINAMGQILKEDDKRIIFMNISELIALHTDFYAQILAYISRYIQPQAGTSPSQTINQSRELGSIFSEFKKRFLIYSTYCCDLPKGNHFSFFLV